MVQIRLGGPDDVEAAVAVYERSALARRHGVWPNRAARVEEVTARLREAGTWFLVAEDGESPVGMACAAPLHGEDGKGPPIPGGCFLNLIFVVPERWGEGIGGAILDTVIVEAKRRDYSRIHLWTHEDNERSHHLYRSRGFAPTGRVAHGEGEWTLQI